MAVGKNQQPTAKQPTPPKTNKGRFILNPQPDVKKTDIAGFSHGKAPMRGSK